MTRPGLRALTRASPRWTVMMLGQAKWHRAQEGSMRKTSHVANREKDIGMPIWKIEKC